MFLWSFNAASEQTLTWSEDFKQGRQIWLETFFSVEFVIGKVFEATGNIGVYTRSLNSIGIHNLHSFGAEEKFFNSDREIEIPRKLNQTEKSCKRSADRKVLLCNIS